MQKAIILVFPPAYQKKLEWKCSHRKVSMDARKSAIFTFTPAEENAWVAFPLGSGWGGAFPNACKPGWTTYPMRRTKFSGLLPLAKEIATVGWVCDFFLMRKAIAPLLNVCSDQLPTNSRYPWVPRTFVWSRSSVPWPVKTQAEDMPKMSTRTLARVTRPPANSCPLCV